MNKNYLVCKSNKIIESSYTLSLNETRVLLAFISQIDSRVGGVYNEEKGFSLTVKQMQDLYYPNKNKRNAYQDLKEACQSLYRRELKLKDDSGRFEVYMRWTSCVEFDNEKMRACIYFHKDIMPHLSQIKSNFTEYRLKWISPLKKKYSIRMYELMVYWYSQNRAKNTMGIQELKKLLGAHKSYKQHSQFNDYVITPATKEINSHTDFNIEVSYHKEGRSFKFITIISTKKDREGKVIKGKAIKGKATKRKATKSIISKARKTSAEKDIENIKHKFNQFKKNKQIKQNSTFYSKRFEKEFKADGCCFRDNPFKKTELPYKYLCKTPLANLFFLEKDEILYLMFIDELTIKEQQVRS